MSWKDHVAALESTGNVTKAAIYGADATLYAKSDDFGIKDSEVQFLITALDHEQFAALLPVQGVVIAGRKYKFLRRDEGRSIFAADGPYGCCLVKSTKTVIVATHQPPISPSNCICEVEKVADWFVSMQM
eukprot:m.24341 g.24341  ORF g.24341 m.24341 type:complete len:130 (+) comp7453_c0_seq2:130-519(+)